MRQSIRRPNAQDAREAHLANDLAQQEIVQLTEDEEDRSQDVVPHRAHLVEQPEHDVRHDPKVQYCRAAGEHGPSAFAHASYNAITTIRPR